MKYMIIGLIFTYRVYLKTAKKKNIVASMVIEDAFIHTHIKNKK